MNKTTTIIFIFAIVCFIYALYLSFKYKYKNIKMCDDKIMTLLQEVAYDYGIRIIKCGKGSICTIVQDTNYIELISDEGYIELDSHNMIPEDCDEQKDFNFDVGNLYLINFKIYGKLYLSYAKSPIECWIIAIRKARKENKKLIRNNKWHIR